MAISLKPWRMSQRGMANPATAGLGASHFCDDRAQQDPIRLREHSALPCSPELTVKSRPLRRFPLVGDHGPAPVRTAVTVPHRQALHVRATRRRASEPAVHDQLGGVPRAACAARAPSPGGSPGRSAQARATSRSSARTGRGERRANTTSQGTVAFIQALLVILYPRSPTTRSSGMMLSCA